MTRKDGLKRKRVNSKKYRMRKKFQKNVEDGTSEIGRLQNPYVRCCQYIVR